MARTAEGHMLEEMRESLLRFALLHRSGLDGEPHRNRAFWRCICHDRVAHAISKLPEENRRVAGQIALSLRPVGGESGMRHGRNETANCYAYRQCGERCATHLVTMLVHRVLSDVAAIPLRGCVIQARAFSIHAMKRRFSVLSWRLGKAKDALGDEQSLYKLPI